MGITAIIGTLFIGLIVGLVARALKPGRDPMGWIMTALLGIAGSFLARFLGAQVGFYRADEPAGFIASVIGAIILLVIWGAVAKK